MKINPKLLQIETSSLINDYYKNEIITQGSFDSLMNTSYEGNETKYYIRATNLTNQPASAYGWLTSYYQSYNTQVQLFIANSGKIYIRRKSGGNWRGWTTII